MTDYNSLENKLTPAAQEVLDEIVADYKFQLLKSAGKSASDVTGEIREISVRDILETLQEIESQNEGKKASLASRYLILTFAGSIAPLILYLIEPIIHISSDESIWIGLLSASLALTGLWLYFLTQGRNLKIGPILFSTSDMSITSKDYSMMFVRKWREIEILSKEVVADFIGESQLDNIPFRRLLEYLLKFDVFTNADSEIFLELLEKRNAVVHSKRGDMTQSEYSELQAKSENILKRLLTFKNKISITKNHL